MSDNSFTAEIVVPHTPEEVFAAVTHVGRWWSEGIEGQTSNLGDEFTFTDYNDLSCRFRLTEVTRPSRVVWQVLDSHLAFVDNHDEWTGTQVVFEITGTADGTRLRFTHQGLRPTDQCYKECSRGWDFYIHRSLKDFIMTGAGDPIRRP